MNALLHKYSPFAVFHAAAYKHIPAMEDRVAEAIHNNVFGLLNLLEAASQHGCASFVHVSSDKAVNPVSVVGVTKRIGECLLSGYPSAGMRAVSVRLGNVLGSSGSVLPGAMSAPGPDEITEPTAIRAGARM